MEITARGLKNEYKKYLYGPDQIGEGFLTVEDANGDEVADRLFEEAMEDGDLEDVDMAILFCSVEFDLEAVVGRLGHRVREAGGELVGGTTSGEISSHGSSQGGAVIMLIQTDEIEFNIGVSEDIWENPIEAGEKAAEEIKEDGFFDTDQNQAVLTIVAGFNSNRPAIEFKLLKGLSRTLGTDIPVAGGSTADDMALGENFQFHNQQVKKMSAVFLGLRTELNVVTGQEHGLREKIKTGLVTESEENVIKEISGEPAAEFYADALDVEVEELKETFESETGTTLQKVFQYALQKTLGEEISQGNIRAVTPVTVTEENGLGVTVEVQESNAIHVIEGDPQDVVGAAANAFPDIGDQEPVFGVISDCAIRSASMSQEEREEEIDRLREKIDAPVIGFYGYGEIGGKENYCTFNNQTVSGLMLTR